MKNNYYPKHKDRLKKGTRERHQNLSNKKKTKLEKWDEKDIKISLK